MSQYVPNLPLVAIILCALLLLALASRVRLLSQILQLAMLAGLVTLAVIMLRERARFDPMLGRIADLVQPEAQQVTGGEVRVPMSSDGHFWVRARINGVATRMLVDSGATVTALSTDTAKAAGLRPNDALVPILLRTANGTVPAQTARVATLRFGPVLARDLSAVVSPAFGDMDVLGMNFLSRLKSWRVEDGTLILVPHHPQEVERGAEPAKGAGGWPTGLLSAWRGRDVRGAS